MLRHSVTLSSGWGPLVSFHKVWRFTHFAGVFACLSVKFSISKIAMTRKGQPIGWSAVKRNFILASIVLMLVSVSTWAQTGTTSLDGVVTDKSGASISDATVTLSSTDQGFQRDTKTNKAGEYEFLSLPPGTYVLTVEMTGFRKFEQPNLQLLVNSPTTTNVMLEIGSSTQTVEVTVQAQVLNTTDASLGNAFSETQVKELPLEAGNVPELLSLQAGVTYTGNRTDINTTTDTRNGAVNGARSDQSNITLDGIDVNSDTKGFASNPCCPSRRTRCKNFA
jgi:hypothetical protein